MKVALSGSHGTGKSTLLRQLEASASGSRFVFLEEIPRALCERVGDPLFLQRGRNTVLRQLLLIAQQIAAESRTTGVPTLVDRSVVDHWAYTLALLGREDWEAPEIGEMRRLVDEWVATYDHIFYLPIEFSLLADEVREDDRDFQREIDGLLRAEYRRLGRDVIEVRGPVDERLTTISELLGEAS